MTMDSEEFVAKMEAGLKPCPWCGAKARFIHAPESWVQCSKCNARTGMRSNEENAVKDWNLVFYAMKYGISGPTSEAFWIRVELDEREERVGPFLVEVVEELNRRKATDTEVAR